MAAAAAAQVIGAKLKCIWHPFSVRVAKPAGLALKESIRGSTASGWTTNY